MQHPQGFPPLPPPSPPLPLPSAPEPEPEREIEEGTDAPPKQVAQAMDRLARAARLIADIRIGADHLLEALLLVAESPHKADKTAELVVAEEVAMRRHFSDLRELGKQLEDSGVLNGSLKSRGNSWGLHMPLVCPDGAVVAYAWKRQLAGQAGASAVDRTRLALKAFTDQKKRFFPHLDNEVNAQSHDGDSRAGKRQRVAQVSILSPKEDYKAEKSLNEIIKDLQAEVLNVKINTYQRLDWSRKASLLSSSSSLNPMEALDDHYLSNASKLRLPSVGTASADQISVIELLVPSVFRAVVSLHPAGSVNPDAVAFFSTDEGGNYIHARGSSVHHVFKQVTGHADKALQYFLSLDSSHSLFLLLQWICSYQTLFSKACSKCGRLLMMDKSLALLLPPVRRAYKETLTSKIRPTESALLTAHGFAAYHNGCSSSEDH